MKKITLTTILLTSGCLFSGLYTLSVYSHYNRSKDIIQNAEIREKHHKDFYQEEDLQEYRWGFVNEILKERTIQEDILFDNISSDKYSSIKAEEFLDNLYKDDHRSIPNTEKFKKDLNKKPSIFLPILLEHIKKSTARETIGKLEQDGITVPRGLFPEELIHKTTEYSTGEYFDHLSIIDFIYDQDLPKLSDGIITKKLQNQSQSDLSCWIANIVLNTLGHETIEKINFYNENSEEIDTFKTYGIIRKRSLETNLGNCLSFEELINNIVTSTIKAVKREDVNIQPKPLQGQTKHKTPSIIH